MLSAALKFPPPDNVVPGQGGRENVELVVNAYNFKFGKIKCSGDG
jgi:hypothetical protein